MKKLIFGSISVLLLGMLLFSVSTGLSSGSNGLSTSGLSSSSQMVRYVVTVHPPTAGNTICGAYQVVMLNAQGGKIAPARIYQPGKSDYTFYEPGPVRLTYRIARLIPLLGGVPIGSDKDNVCIYPLATPPDIQRNTFNPGSSYSFNLYPGTH
jgi:hypothetical protein